jgi:ribulose-5-phosphate 4-epimerase/fuculose-1-phosphate aldolase
VASSEQEVRHQLALACRILGQAGQGDNVLGHLSARVPGIDRFLMKRAGLGLEEITEDDLVLLDLDGKVLAGGPAHREVPIHSRVLRARPDVNCVVHTHATHAIALAARGLTVKRVSQDGSFFAPGVPVFDEFTELVLSDQQGDRVAGCLADRQALLLLNHGMVVTGADIPGAAVSALMLDRACAIQLLAQPTAETSVREAPLEEAYRVQAIRRDHQRSAFDYLVRRLPAL